MYNNGFQTNYPMTYQQQIQQLQQQIQQSQAQQQSASQPNFQNGGLFYFVNSRSEAENWVIGAGQTAFFFERNEPVFYIKSVAQNGLSQPLEVYDYTQRVNSQNTSSQQSQNDDNDYVTREEFNELKSELETMKGAEG